MEAAGAADSVDFAVLIDVTELTVRSGASEVVEAILRITSCATMELEDDRIVNGFKKARGGVDAKGH